ncbi:hypothetical protein E8E13_010874 [Curvularia kusanoi]|uniref:Heterokaryon incompatibility domain-containing protein n=1 Tax=Curvularia kusanoi TaxID=90978 RepID=A0A9P4TK03_CURKU|nr:hypothetical protein E8E13_010874 [Curvularia kusanoi]
MSLGERLREATKNDDDYVEEWSALWDVVKSPWWTRAWIFQEFVVAPSAIFLHSHQHVTWERLHSAMSVLIHSQRADDDHIPTVHRRINPVPSLEMVATLTQQKAHWTGVQDLKTLLSRSRKTSASNLRDKIYAVIGLADSGYNIVPNYEQPLNDVLIETTRRIIEFENSLSVLVYGSQLSQNIHLPSWVIDWTQTGNRDECLFPQSDLISPGTAETPFKFQVATGDRPALMVWGAYYGSVCAVKKHPHFSVTKGWLVDEVRVRSQGNDSEPFLCKTGVEDDDELWDLQGSVAAVFLRRSGHGYRLISPASPNNKYKQDWPIAQSDTCELQRISII